MDNKTRNKKVTSVLYIALTLMLAALMFTALYTAVATVARRARAGDETTAGETSADASETTADGKTRTDGKKPVSDDTAAESDKTASAPETDAALDISAATDDGGAIAVNGEEDALPLPTVFRLPVNGSVSRLYSDDTLVYSLTMNDYRTHTALDIAAPVGTAVLSCADGVVESVYEDPFYGICVTVAHGGELKSTYCGLSPELPRGVDVGTTLLAGDMIGSVGDTIVIEMADSSHLHLEMTLAGAPVDPLTYLAYEVSASVEYEG